MAEKISFNNDSYTNNITLSSPITKPPTRSKRFGPSSYNKLPTKTWKAPEQVQAQAKKEPDQQPTELPIISPPQMEELTDTDEDEDVTEREDEQVLVAEPLLNAFSMKNRTRTLVHTHVDGDEIIQVEETIDVTIPRFNTIFWIEIVEMAFFTSLIIISYLVMGDIVVINTYIFLIAGSIISLIILSLHLFNIILYQRSNPDLSSRHSKAIYFTAGTAIFTQIFTWLSLGRWIISYGFCCGTAENQPNPLDITNFTRFYLAYAVMFVLDTICLIFCYANSITAHMYPETSGVLTEDKKTK
jgi:hypothetical protein